jgi:hypothetical protein
VPGLESSELHLLHHTTMKRKKRKETVSIITITITITMMMMMMAMMMRNAHLGVRWKEWEKDWTEEKTRPKIGLSSSATDQYLSMLLIEDESGDVMAGHDGGGCRKVPVLSLMCSRDEQKCCR